MKVNCLYDKLVPISELKPHPKNRNSHPDSQLVRLAQILEYQGWRYPIKVSKLSGFITSGHGRLEAAKKAGFTQVPVNFQEYDSEAQEYADLIADNGIALWSELDIENIKNDIPELPDLDFNLLGLGDKSLDIFADEILKEPDEKNEPTEKEADMTTCPNCGVIIDG